MLASVLPKKRFSACEHLEQHCTERKNVRTFVDYVALHLFWRHVLQGSMLVAVSGHTLSEQAGDTSAILHARKTGEVEFISARPVRRWTNMASTPARYIIVTFRETIRHGA